MREEGYCTACSNLVFRLCHNERCDVTGPEKQFQDAAVSVKEKRFKEAAAACNKIMADVP